MLMAVRYAHTLLFACPDCNNAVSVTRFSEYENLESVEQQGFHLTCVYCLTNFERPGYSAKTHSVQECKAIVAE